MWLCARRLPQFALRVEGLLLKVCDLCRTGLKGGRGRGLGGGPCNERRAQISETHPDMLTRYQQDRERKTGWAGQDGRGPSWRESPPDATFPPRPHRLPLPVPDISNQESLVEGGWSRLRGAGMDVGEGNCPCPRGRMEVSIQGGGKQPPPEPPISLLPRWAEVREEPLPTLVLC